MTDFTQYVNIKQGTASDMRFSTGSTLPLVAAPWGMNAFALQTRAADEGWFYHPAHRQTEGVRLTHQPSPWVRDYAHFVFMPQSGKPCTGEHERTSGFEEITMSPACMVGCGGLCAPWLCPLRQVPRERQQHAGCRLLRLVHRAGGGQAG